MRVKLLREWMGHPKDSELIIQNHLGVSLVSRGGAINLDKKQIKGEGAASNAKILRRPEKNKMVKSSLNK